MSSISGHNGCSLPACTEEHGSKTNDSQPNTNGITRRSSYGIDPFDRFDTSATGRLPGMAIQQELGVWTQRRTRFGGADRDHPFAASRVLTWDAFLSLRIQSVQNKVVLCA